MTSSFAYVLLTSLALAPPLHDVAAFSTPAITITSSTSCISDGDVGRCHHRGEHSALFLAKGVGGSTAASGKQQRGGKKRRFLQQAHPVPPPAPPQQPQQPIRTTPKAENGNSAVGNLGGLTNGSKNSAAPSTTAVAVESSDTKSTTRRGPPLQTSKSIEDLEAILEKRWGTAQTQKPSTNRKGNKGNGDGDDDADFVMSFGDDNDEYDTAPKKERKRNQVKEKDDSLLRGAAVFRSNRAVDPWAKEEGLFDDTGKKGSSVNVDKDDERKGNDKEKKGPRYDWDNDKKEKKQRYDRQEAMLNRVRSNQERLQSTKQPSQRGDVKKGKEEGYEQVPVDVSKDYYDADDEGYEGGDKRKNSLLSPKPVGGKGKSNSSLPSSSLSGGIFSDRPSGREDERRPGREEQVEEKKKRPKKKIPQGKPLLDEEGNEMFLTLEQADTIVKGIVSSSKEGSDDVADAEISTWEDVGITDEKLLTNLRSSTMSCPAPLAVQDRACPPLVAGNDVLISTHTGSGKTLAFLAPIAQSLLIDKANGNNNKQAKALVVAPGRELASQIVSVAQELFAGTGLTVSMAIGGTPYSRNVEKLRKKKPDLVVGTPGRLAELIIGRPGDKGGKLKVSGLQTVVLDEFDALLQYDANKEPTMAIMDALDRQHGKQSSLQRVLCSATASDMLGLTREKDGVSLEDYLRPGYAHASVDDADVLVTAGVESTTKGGSVTKSARVSRTTIHGALHVPHKRLALEAVRKVLNTEPIPQQALVFVDSPRRVDIVIEKLAAMDIVAAPLHGGSGKGDRSQVNRALREGYVGIVVATEMAARGIDAPYLTHVINLDLPTDASHYAHRAGRCGRGGRPGVAVSITCDVREKNVPKRFAEELGIDMYNVEARGGKLRIVE